jgi:hypothetical protein
MHNYTAEEVIHNIINWISSYTARQEVNNSSTGCPTCPTCAHLKNSCVTSRANLNSSLYYFKISTFPVLKVCEPHCSIYTARKEANDRFKGSPTKAAIDPIKISGVAFNANSIMGISAHEHHDHFLMSLLGSDM